MSTRREPLEQVIGTRWPGTSLASCGSSERGSSSRPRASSCSAASARADADGAHRGAVGVAVAGCEPQSAISNTARARRANHRELGTGVAGHDLSTTSSGACTK